MTNFVVFSHQEPLAILAEPPTILRHLATGRDTRMPEDPVLPVLSWATGAVLCRCGHPRNRHLEEPGYGVTVCEMAGCRCIRFIEAEPAAAAARDHEGRG